MNYFNFSDTIEYYSRVKDVFAIGPHRFHFNGPASEYAGWLRHLNRCRDDYEIRLRMRGEFVTWCDCCDGGEDQYDCTIEIWDDPQSED